MDVERHLWLEWNEQQGATDMKFLNQDIATIGMGCWPIGGPMFSGDQSLGYSNSNDDESIRTIHAALAAGIMLFDTAAAYGAGHAERLLARALKDRPNALIVTKIGIGIDEVSKQLTFDPPKPASVMPAIEACLSRLERDRIDLLLLHQNELPLSEAAPIFDQMERARQAGKIGAYGWSTDFSESVAGMAGRESFAAVEHAMNVFFDAPRIQRVVTQHQLPALIRSPLAMGLLSGKYDAKKMIPANDIRASSAPQTAYFNDGRANADFLKKLHAVRDLLTTDGRSLVQGAIAWLWAKSDCNIPIPGARTVDQIEGIAGALEFGPLPKDIMRQIDINIDREPADIPDMAR
jgi:aryl-alcohol dehydrogenase-like predicted oxidoreductase